MLDAAALATPRAAVARRGRGARKSGHWAWKYLRVAAVTLLCVVWLLPVIFVVMASVKNSDAMFSKHGLISIPTSITWSNFSQAWSEGSMGIYMRNSAIITLIKVPLAITVESLLAYALAYRESRLRTFIFGFVLVGMIFPPQAALVPLHSLLQDWHIFNSWVGLILVYLGFGLPFGTLLLRGFFRTVPRELHEAARVDGAGPLRILWRIVVPMSWPAIAALAIFDTVWTWNEFLFAELFITNSNLRPVQAGLVALNGQYSMNITLLSAGVVLSIIPIVVVYVMFQRKFVSGLSGAIKG
ncbi:MAG: carbohydrate ABC transporter permease [Acidimicrobiales bacterium]